MSDRATVDAPSSHAGPGARALALVRRQWLPILLAVIAVVFIVQNRQRTRIDFLFLHVTTPLWLTLTIVCLIGVVIGWFARRRRR
ncbi:lipopolysaccharide assembly protein LapA domain-containing protein [Gordonia soli]|uniref:Lipopolysaccharide assembly protein A domain-containing protein n=1 Tax=Gordonia soli NBRC 108243 TaxID=1223545 RepID=M0QJI0_9ACTN|nr:LapA family protein [Gordonia soli]GAC68780.1 hypothetical protein GS4_18_00680 [Gordonia soli NBRC 108243]